MNEYAFKREECVKVLEKLLCDLIDEAETIKHYTVSVHEVLNNVENSPTRMNTLKRLEHIIAEEMEHIMLLGQCYSDMTNIAVEVYNDVPNKSVQSIPLQQ